MVDADPDTDAEADAELVVIILSSSRSSSVNAADAKRGVVARIISSTDAFRFSYNKIFNVSS